jgi:hypothetical protein
MIRAKNNRKERDIQGIKIRRPTEGIMRIEDSLDAFPEQDEEQGEPVPRDPTAFLGAQDGHETGGLDGQ